MVAVAVRKKDCVSFHWLLNVLVDGAVKEVLVEYTSGGVRLKKEWKGQEDGLCCCIQMRLC